MNSVMRTQAAPASAAEPLPVQPMSTGREWRVLVVDSDPDVHAGFRMALQGHALFGRPLVLLHALSQAQARALLRQEHDLAVVVLDAAPPQAADDAGPGLELVDFIRHTAGLRNSRIVLRTDLPGQVPDMDTLLRYDINDCRTKTELTPDRLLAIVVTAVRSYEQLCAIEATLRHNRGLLERLHQSAYYDPLVCLPNRAHFVEKVDECVWRGTHGHVLALLDIDDFSATNDVMGHRFGDRLLEAVARRLAGALPPGLLLARVGSDTFGILGATDEVALAQLLDCARQPLSVNGVPHKLSLTCGYVRLPHTRQAGTDLVKDATIALKRAKREHRGQLLQYSEQMGMEARDRALLLSDLRAAIDDAHLFLVYQPQVDLHSHALVGLEALLRWRKHDGSMVPPDRFIPVAEHSGLIVPLGQWVLTTACRTMRELLDAGRAPLRMAVNVSTVQLKDPGFLQTVRHALSQHGLQGAQLELEITESVAVLPTQLLQSTLSALRALGVTMAIDDFGTGYSSLSYLERLPLDRIKIDRSFVRQLGESQEARIAEMVAQLGRKLGLQVLAEGIEDAAAWQALRGMGCHEGQGYHIAMPMDKERLLEWLQQHRGG